MSVRVWILALVAVGTLGWFGRGAFSDGDKPAMPSEAEMEKLFEQLATPGPMHQWLARMNGSWRVSGYFVEQDGAKHPLCGTACFRMVLGGRWQEQTFSSVYKGKPFQGRGLTGFDNDKQRFENIWLDTMGTASSSSTGTLSDDGKILTLTGMWDMAGMKMPFKYVLTWLDACRVSFKMYMTMEAQDQLMGDLTYTRR